MAINDFIGMDLKEQDFTSVEGECCGGHHQWYVMHLGVGSCLGISYPKHGYSPVWFTIERGSCSQNQTSWGQKLKPETR